MTPPTNSDDHKNLQELLIERIVSQFNKRSEAISAIEETLGINRDSVYRRLRGATLFTPTEIQQLALKFKISLDALIYEDHNMVLFQYRPMTKPIKHLEQYLKTVYKDMERMFHTPDHKLFYACSDIPIFFFFIIPELTSIKLYIWGRMIWELDYLKTYKFDFDLIPPTTHVLAREINRVYMGIPSIDIWNINVFDNTLNQLDYLVGIGAFKNLSDAIIVCDKLLELATLMQYMAEKGRKGGSKNAIEASNVGFELYQNEIAHTNNTVLAVSRNGRVVFSSFDDPNFLRSTDPQFGINTERWFNKLIARSSSISVNTERRRQWFFNVLEGKINALRSRIQLLIQERDFPRSFIH